MSKHLPNTLAVIRRSPLFHALQPDILARLSGSAKVLELERGKCLPRDKGRVPGVYIVASGCLILSVGTAEARKVIELVGAGGHLGLAATMLGASEVVNAETLTDSSLLLIPRATLLACVAETPRLAMKLAMSVSRQVQRLIADIEGYSLHSGRERVADYLLQLAGGSGIRPAPRTQSRAIKLPAKKSIIASRLSLTPEYFSRTLHELIDAGAIAVNGRQITLLDTARLTGLDPSHQAVNDARLEPCAVDPGAGSELGIVSRA